MIIKELVLHNFGIYAFTNKFEFHGTKPIVLIGGMNGRGKTTFLEAVLLALYGSNSFAYIESKYRSFGQYLRSFINTTDGTLKTYVELEFVMGSEKQELYRIQRAWTGEKKRISERIQVFKDHEYNQFLTDNWSMFIENILPSGLSNFFFFDGEKIAELAVDNTSNQMKESIKSLLGISVLDLLKSDLKRINKRIIKNSVINLEAEEIEQIRNQKDIAQDVLKQVDVDLELLEKKKTEILQELEQMQQKYSAKGGNIANQRQTMFENRIEISTKIDSYREKLILDAASGLPLALVENLLRNIIENAKIEQDKKMLEIALRKMQMFSNDYEKENFSDTDAISRFMEFVSAKMDKRELNVKYNLSDSALSMLQILLDHELYAIKDSVKKRQSDLIKLQEKKEEFDNYLSVDIDEKAVAKIYKRIKELEQKLIELDVQIENKTNERRTRNGELIKITSIFNKRVEKYLKKVELNDDGDRIIKYSNMAQTILEEYKIRLQKKKVSVVAEVMTECYKKLANKKNLIDKIQMDPVTLDLKYVKQNGDVLDKASLSAGEKQLMVIALLWTLAVCSKKKLPVIIDTPLSRLDSAHRASLINTYFPQASDQTIILSTDSEIDYNYYQMMKKNIGDEFTLVYDDHGQSTTICRGYFTEVER